MSVTKIDCYEFHISIVLTHVKNVLPTLNMISMYRTKELVAKTTVHYTRVNFLYHEMYKPHTVQQENFRAKYVFFGDP